MKRILFILLLTIPFIGISQTRIYECNCEETNFRQTWEIDLENQTIRRSSSVNLEDGEIYEGEELDASNVIWKDDFIYFLFQDGDVYFYRFDLVQNRFFSEIYDGLDGTLFKQVYDCFWTK